MTNLTEKQLAKDEENIKEAKQKLSRSLDSVLDEIPSRYCGVEEKDVPSDVWDKFSDNGKEINGEFVDGKHGLYIHGDVGVGKTYLGYAILKKDLSAYYRWRLKMIDENYKKYQEKYIPPENHFSSYYSGFQPDCFFNHKTDLVNFPRLLQKIKNTFGTKESSDIEEYFIGSILILDDIGAEKFTDWSIENLYRLVDCRYENELQTVFISNLSLKELSEKVGDRVASRITEMCHIIKMKGKDRRVN
jgi:DNA replication protein DnaC